MKDAWIFEFKHADKVEVPGDDFYEALKELQKFLGTPEATKYELKMRDVVSLSAYLCSCDKPRVIPDPGP